MILRTSTLCAVALLSAVGPAKADPADACARTQAAVDAEVRTAKSGHSLRRLAPYVSGEGAAALAARTLEAEEELAFDAYVAVGLSREARGLVALGELPPVATPLARLGRALALLSLGDGSETGTIAAALESGPLSHRRLAAAALARLKHVRPLVLLYDRLEDDDEEIRLYAARGLLSDGSSKARRELERIARDPASKLRARAARALIDVTRVRPEIALDLPEPVRGRAVAAVIARGRKHLAGALQRDLRSPDPDRRATALAALAVVESAARLRRIAEGPLLAAGEDGAAELAMALALCGDAGASATLQGLDRDGVERAVAVLWAFSGAAQEGLRIDDESASRLARVIERWMVAGTAGPRGASRSLRAMEAIERENAAALARTRLLGPGGWGLRTAFRILARAGNEADVPAILAAAGRLPAERTRAEGWRAAARLCAR